MNEPKFSIGQAVAVCTKELESVIPATIVTELKLYTGEAARHPVTGRQVPPYTGWAYRVAAGFVTADGTPAWYPEQHLRPIDPDTEYQDERAREVSL